jgi:hypothetical protein
LNLLWTDDDCELSLEPLGWFIQEDGGFSITKATNYRRAMGILTSTVDDETSHIKALLLDIILPHSEGGASTSRYLGLTLAKEAAERGTQFITFLTVVPRVEVREHYEELKKTYPQVHFNYFNKQDLLEPNKIDSIIKSLQPSTNNGR